MCIPLLQPVSDRVTLITVSNLSKKFGTVTAVDAISFEVFEGEIFGLVGLNGAGKTTTMLILSSLLNPNSGSASVCGYDIMNQKDDVRRSIGFVFEEEAVDIYLTGRQNLDFAARMYSLSRPEREKMVASVLKTVGLEQHANSKVRNYSGGMLRRLEIARGMLTSPPGSPPRRADYRAGRSDTTICLGLHPENEQGDGVNCSVSDIIS